MNNAIGLSFSISTLNDSVLVTVGWMLRQLIVGIVKMEIRLPTVKSS